MIAANRAAQEAGLDYRAKAEALSVTRADAARRLDKAVAAELVPLKLDAARNWWMAGLAFYALMGVAAIYAALTESSTASRGMGLIESTLIALLLFETLMHRITRHIVSELPMAGDVVAFPVDGLELAGAAVHDPVAALVFCTPPRVRHSIIHGRPVVEDGELLTLDLPPLVATHNRLARQLADTRA